MSNDVVRYGPMVILLIQDVKHQITHWEWTMNKLKNNHYGVYFVMNFRVVTLIDQLMQLS